MKLHDVLLIVLLLGVFLSKLYLVTLVEYPAYDSYYGMRQVDAIHKTGVPLLYDSLSYQGRSSFSNPLAYYVFTLFSFVIPMTLLFKFGGVVLSIIALFLIYYLSQKIYKQSWLSLLLVALAAFNSTIYNAHLNTLIPSSLFLILFLLLIHTFLEKKHTYFVLIAIISTLISSLSLVLVLGFLIYFILLKIENLSVKNTEFELLFFSAVFVIWYNLISYKKLLFTFGSQSIWKSIPFELQSVLFSELNISAALALIGIIPLALGIYGIYTGLFEKRNRKVIFIIAFALAFGILSWLGFIPIAEGLLYIILCFILVSGHSILQIRSFFDKTIVTWLTPIFIVLIIFISLLSFSTVFIYKDAVALNAPTQDEIDTMDALSKYVPVDETVVAHIKQGHLISELAHRKNFYDEYFVLAPRSQQRYTDARTIFLSQSQATVLGVLQSYDVKYILLSPLTKKEYPSTTSLFATSDCFDLIYSTNTTEVYKVQCILKT